MGRFLLKPDPREDFYVEYSTVVDAPVSWGSREEFENFDKSSHEPPLYSEERFARADATGSSSLIGSYSYEVDSVMIREGFNPSDFPCAVDYCEIPRSSLRDFLESSFDESNPSGGHVFDARFPSLRYYAFGDEESYEILREDF